MVCDLPDFMQVSVKESSNFGNFGNNEPCCVGIDEAGRGPVLGPLVYAAAIVPIALTDNIQTLGINDSKKLTDEKRRKCYKNIKNEGAELIAYAHYELPARYVSAYMLALNSKSLNEMSHNCAIDLIKHAIARGINVKQAFVDTVGPKAKYQELLEHHFPDVTITVTEKADSEFLVVGAASIVAKVKRDDYLAAHSFEEPDILKPEKGFGSGYPGDPLTIQYMCDHSDPIFGYNRLVRFSWKTAIQALNRASVKVNKIESDPKPTLLNFFKRTRDSTIDKASFFKRRKITHLTEF